MTAVAGLRGTGDWATDERPKNFREFILFRNPNGSAPMTALTGKTSSDSTDDPEFSWWDEANDIIRLRVNGALTAAATSVVVDSSDPSASTPGNVWGLATHLVPGDILLVEKTETATYDNELVIVTDVVNSTTFSVTRGFAGTTAATLADNSFLLKIGSAFAEGTPSPDAASRNPTKFFNYCQIFKTSYELTRTAKGTRTRTGDPLKNDKKRKMFDHSRDIEHALMFGVRSETTGTNGKPLRTMNGLRSFIPAANQTVFSVAATTSTFLDATYKVFDFDTEAGDERIVFCGNGFLNEINKIAAAAGTINFTETVKMYGMNLRKYVLPQGTLFLRTHPLMNRNTLYTNSAFIIDPTALIWRHFMDTKSQSNIQGNDEDTEKGQWITEAGLEIRYAGLTCGYIGNLSST